MLSTLHARLACDRANHHDNSSGGENFERPGEILADFAWFPEVKRLIFDRAHVEGVGVGTLGRSGLNEVKVALAEFGGQHEAEAVIFQGANRTSGRLHGRMPTMVVIPC